MKEWLPRPHLDVGQSAQCVNGMADLHDATDEESKGHGPNDRMIDHLILRGQTDDRVVGPFTFGRVRPIFRSGISRSADHSLLGSNVPSQAACPRCRPAGRQGGIAELAITFSNREVCCMTGVIDAADYMTAALVPESARLASFGPPGSPPPGPPLLRPLMMAAFEPETPPLVSSGPPGSPPPGPPSLRPLMTAAFVPETPPLVSSGPPGSPPPGPPSLRPLMTAAFVPETPPLVSSGPPGSPPPGPPLLRPLMMAAFEPESLAFA